VIVRLKKLNLMPKSTQFIVYPQIQCSGCFKCQIFLFRNEVVQCVGVNCRIGGNAALSKDIHASVSAQMKKNFAKSRWKVSGLCLLTDFTHVCCLLIPLECFDALN